MHELPPRVLAKIAFPADEDGCWIWTASLRDGYGQIRCGQRIRSAHVVVYEILVGAVAAGLELDHLCRDRRCVNPSHLEEVTHRENLLRGDTAAARNAAKEKCSRGHDLVRPTWSKSRYCPTCKRATRKRFNQRQRAARQTQVV